MTKTLQLWLVVSMFTGLKGQNCCYVRIRHTILHNWSLQNFSQDYNQHLTPLMLCTLILNMSGGTYSLKSISNDRFLKSFSWHFLFTLRVFARNMPRRNRQRNTFCILFWCLAWGSNPGFTSNKPTHYVLDYGDFRFLTLFYL